MTLEQEIKSIIAEQLGIEESEVTSEKAFGEDLNADSLDLTELIMNLEGKFGIEFSDKDQEKLRTVQDVIDYIKERVK